MPRKKSISPEQVSLPANHAEAFADARRVVCFNREDGERFLELLIRAKIKPQFRRNEHLKFVFAPIQFVIDLTQ